jgi:hypothetical protein
MSEDRIQPPNEQVGPANNAGQPPEKPPLGSVTENKIDPTKITNNPRTDQKKRKHKPLSCFEIWMVVLSVFGILVAAATGVAIVWQDIIANAALVELQKQFPELQKSAAAADQGVKDARSNFENDERPYIWIRSKLDAPQFRFNPINNNQGQILWDWHVVNYGKTPAQNVRFTQYMKIGNKPFVFSYGEKENNPSAPIPPNADIVFDTIISAPITPKQYADLIKTDGGIQIKVVLNYSGLQGGGYETSLCLSRLQNGAISFCKPYNYIK